MVFALAVGKLALLAGGLAPLQGVGGVSRPIILGLLAVLVLPVVTILFVGHLVGEETIEEGRIERLESEVSALREEVGLGDDEDRTQ